MDGASAGARWGEDEERKMRERAKETVASEGLVRLLIEAGRAIPPRGPRRAEILFQRIVAELAEERPRQHRDAR
jgi:hypothetical protein